MAGSAVGAGGTHLHRATRSFVQDTVGEAFVYSRTYCQRVGIIEEKNIGRNFECLRESRRFSP